MNKDILERFGVETADKDEIIDLLWNEIDLLENTTYCQKCDSCGESDCCQPKCMYVETHKEDYKQLCEENEEMFNMLKKIRFHIRTHMKALDPITIKVIQDIDNMKKVNIPIEIP